MNIKINPNFNTLHSDSKNKANKNIAFGTTKLSVRDIETKFARTVDVMERIFEPQGEKGLLKEQAELFRTGKWNYSKEESGGNLHLFKDDEGDTFTYLESFSRDSLPQHPAEIYICTGGYVDDAKEIIYSVNDRKMLFPKEWGELISAITQAISK